MCCVQMEEAKAEECQAKAKYLHEKIPQYRKHKPGFPETDLFIDEILEEYDKIWLLWEYLWPDFDVEKDVPMTFAMGMELCKALARCHVTGGEAGVLPDWHNACRLLDLLGTGMCIRLDLLGV
ncbi:uncharacterized protein BJ212DRAFT_1298670 [Suillus subaureus]|uniref:Uncharacterized protein n=1 Tax=Suillus subaureus TaxID=48587 RepID=A0A9P7JEW4_9AGAM|nr:uncharacterized protein BJ212DRAFT_1298670 [Suillus subaureus]KAG1818596.1 hypothetical protein BJ212DRAFT_1298670 [Suillus subaureus]